MTDAKKQDENDLVLLEPGEVRIMILDEVMYVCAEMSLPGHLASWRKVDLGKAGLPAEVIALMGDRTYYPAAMRGSETFELWEERNKVREPLVATAQPS